MIGRLAEACRDMWAWITNTQRIVVACVHDYSPCGETHFELEFGGDVLIFRCRACPAWRVDRSHAETVTMKAVR